jgi:hypothetical protein
MIRVTLFDSHDHAIRVEFESVPLVRYDGFRTEPPEAISPDLAAQLADELAHGSVKGWIEGYRWYRQVGTNRRPNGR